MADVGTKTAAALTAELAKEKFDKEVDSEEIRSFSRTELPRSWSLMRGN